MTIRVCFWSIFRIISGVFVGLFLGLLFLLVSCIAASAATNMLQVPTQNGSHPRSQSITSQTSTTGTPSIVVTDVNDIAIDIDIEHVEDDVFDEDLPSTPVKCIQSGGRQRRKTLLEHLDDSMIPVPVQIRPYSFTFAEDRSQARPDSPMLAKDAPQASSTQNMVRLRSLTLI